ncbi:MAG: hypothetical protein VKJ64_10695 [Leptolyngbyaceae bacterium]|nr:hypothetical protein [Leptolyngbyaceae bacterium]
MRLSLAIALSHFPKAIAPFIDQTRSLLLPDSTTIAPFIHQQRSPFLPNSTALRLLKAWQRPFFGTLGLWKINAYLQSFTKLKQVMSLYVNG